MNPLQPLHDALVKALEAYDAIDQSQLPNTAKYYIPTARMTLEDTKDMIKQAMDMVENPKRFK